MRAAAFRELFGRDPDVVARAPGRVNLIGEHTDYNDGFVLPAAIPLDTEVQLGRRRDRRVQVWSAAFPDSAPVSFDLDALTPVRDWTDYIRAMVSVLRERGVSTGVDLRNPFNDSARQRLVVQRGTPRGRRPGPPPDIGVEIDDVEIAVLARRAENEFVGAPVGIMDQMASSLADAASALLIDTRSLAHERIPLPSGARLLVIDSGIRHAHAIGGYRARRDECERAAASLRVRALRDVTTTDLSRVALLPPPLDRRARHVVTENARVLDTADALRRGDVGRAGELFLASHASMRDDFEVSVPEVDALVAEAAATPGVFGARLTGGGFGGSNRRARWNRRACGTWPPPCSRGIGLGSTPRHGWSSLLDNRSSFGPTRRSVCGTISAISQPDIVQPGRSREMSRSRPAITLGSAVLAGFVTLTAQTKITAPPNKYSPSDDVKLGQQAAEQVRQQMPIMHDDAINGYLSDIGDRLVRAIPPEFQHPEFHYTFTAVNLKEINAFALPGGPMFVNRGMMDKAHTEGEIAGVMAHELSHVALRHGTAQETRRPRTK